MTAAEPRARPAGLFEVELLAEMHKAIFTAPWDREWSEESLARSLETPGARAWLLERESVPLGFALAIFTLDEGEVVLAGILPDGRGQGHGLRLMQAVIEAARAAGLARLCLEHAAANAAAERLYRRLGFHRIGRRPGYYRSRQPSGPLHDAVVMALDLAPPEPHSAKRIDEGG